MTPAAYKQATPFIKEIGEIDQQIAAIKNAAQLKISIGAEALLAVNPSSFGDVGTSKVREAILEVLQTKKQYLETELGKI